MTAPAAPHPFDADTALEPCGESRAAWAPEHCFAGRLAVGPVWEEDGELWTPGGGLVAQSRQLALVPEPAP